VPRPHLPLCAVLLASACSDPPPPSAPTQAEHGPDGPKTPEGFDGGIGPDGVPADKSAHQQGDRRKDKRPDGPPHTTPDGQPLMAPLAEVADPSKGLAPYEVPVPDWMSPPPSPPDNPPTHAGVDLGRHLFYDPLLSGNDTQSCGSCHHQERSFADRRGVSIGSTGKRLARNAMPLVNLAWTAPYFWDGRAPTLEALVPIPIQHPDEMNEDMDTLIGQLSEHPDYPARFEAAFPGEGITEGTISKAVAQFMRTMVSFNSRADLLDAGLTELTELEMRGNALMVDGLPKGAPDRVQDICDACHKHSAGVKGGSSNMGLFTVSKLKTNGLPIEDGDDDGAGGRFMVPSIRNLTVTAPYMHDGRFEDLTQVVEHYNTQMVASTHLEPPLAKDGQPQKMRMNEEDVAATVAMIGIFTDPHFLTNPAYGSPFPPEE